MRKVSILVGAVAVASILASTLGCAKKEDEAANVPPPGVGPSTGTAGTPSAAGQQSVQPRVPTGSPP